MIDRFEALTEVTLAIARASAQENPQFGRALEATLRDSLRNNTNRPRVFEETLFWLELFELNTHSFAGGSDGGQRELPL